MQWFLIDKAINVWFFWIEFFFFMTKYKVSFYKFTGHFKYQDNLVFKMGPSAGEPYWIPQWDNQER